MPLVYLGFKTPMVCCFTLFPPHSVLCWAPFPTSVYNLSSPPSHLGKDELQITKEGETERQRNTQAKENPPRPPTPAVYHAPYWVLKNLSFEINC